MISAATTSSGTVAHALNQERSRTTTERHVLAAINVASMANWIPPRRSVVWPFNFITVRTMIMVAAALAQRAAPAAAQPWRLTGLWDPSTWRKTIAVTAMQSAPDATLKATFIAPCLRKTAKTNVSATMQHRTSILGERYTSPRSMGTSMSTKRWVLPR